MRRSRNEPQDEGVTSMKRTVFVTSVAACLTLYLSGDVLAGCYIQFNAEANRVMQMGGNTQRGSFADRNACDNYQRSRSDFEQRNSWCVCTQSGGGAVASPGGYGGQNFQMQLFQGLLGVFMQAITQDSSSQPQESATRTVKIEWSDEEQAKMKAQVQQMESEYNRLKAEELQKGLAKLKGGLKGRSSLSAENHGKTHPSRSLAQLNCSAYWGLKAAGGILEGAGDEYARYYGESSSQAAGTLAGPECPGAGPVIPAVPEPVSDDFRSGMYMYMISEIDTMIPAIKGLQARRQSSENRIVNKQQEIDKLQAQQASLSDVNAKAAVDALLQEAMAALSEAREEEAAAAKELAESERKLEAMQKMYDYHQKRGSASQ